MLLYTDDRRSTRAAIAVEIHLADDIAREAETAGLLTPDALAQLVNEVLKSRKVDSLFSKISRLRDVTPPMTHEEIQTEIDDYRVEKRAACAVCTETEVTK
jgi:hypothetical protein